MVTVELTLQCDRCKAPYGQTLKSDSLDLLVRSGTAEQSVRKSASVEGWLNIEDLDLCPKCKPESSNGD